jgi:hypothetical protein
MDFASTPTNVVDLATYRSRRIAVDDVEAAGRRVLAELSAEADDAIAPWAAQAEH